MMIAEKVEKAANKGLWEAAVWRIWGPIIGGGRERET